LQLQTKETLVNVFAILMHLGAKMTSFTHRLFGILFKWLMIVSLVSLFKWLVSSITCKWSGSFG